MTLFLIGTIESSNPEKSLALFTESSVKLVPINGSIQGYRVTKVKDRVAFLEKAGKTYWVRAGEGLDGDVAVTIKTGFERKGDDVIVSDELRRFIVGEGLVTTLMSTCSEPVIENGEMVGFKLFEIDAGSAFEIAGFKDGDVVIEVDGQPLKSTLTAIRVLKDLMARDEFAFAFKRGGQVERRRVVVR